MVRDFLAKRDLKGKLSVLALIQKDIDLFENALQELIPVFQDISDTVRKAWKLHLKESLQLLLTRDELVETIDKNATLPLGSFKISDLISEARQQITESLTGLPAALYGRLYRAFPTAFPDQAWVSELLSHIARTGGRAVAEIATVLDANGQIEALADYLKKAVRNRTLTQDLLIWTCKERDGLAKSVFSIDLAHAVLDTIEDDHVSGGPKRTGRLIEVLSSEKTLIGEWVQDPDEEMVQLFIKRLLSSTVLDELTRRSLMARVIKARPELETLMEDQTGNREDNSLIVSWDSLEKKKAELHELITVKIPHNHQEIQIAKEEGDLRENGGYKAARDQQAVLNRMRDELERDINRARGTDFANVSTDVVGMGTIVDYTDEATGQTETLTILGAWDSDIEKHIVSYLSELAKSLLGKAIGDEAEIPTDHGTRKVKITAIRPWNPGT